mgnify:CR=1 FL=1|jgi:hypothetical protein|tara:strand:+ start:791 stop:1003 length:213 start_codon:yes stop_codon:yes gene_type:complete
MARFKILNGISVQLTAEEEILRDAEEAQAAIDKQAAIDAQTASDAKKASGKQKLKDLGLDDDEIKSLMGV